ncbi:Com family DNA-binding transcriptional regulator [Sulfitobacter sp. M57]|uniref:Com family DNA-binding transcriptional regulator n=1 Tax=Sulfitobacter sp. KE42 TaxID=2731155 RepID=UPI002A2E6D97|nr:Com family DNA-binding transcriptional regulator [Sulfitobacter sp. KE5]MDF3421161.1 Com family DNA-binding transcriptional regulator [Sulfitobacter sp. KE43]MDF3432104.1 Com family DNA-binding transcriptional regulator [Sulfitobacter sp. KE42]MDF3457744.1 Com family DNA-binding transcriptional regulator [Sulfitobacter sp. S74]MDF3461645.1 Com family DNA-binding transcriptional regulator [Sulfitobacter sp. Ks18]MDF3465545.1 Com family DNA-binding transcriptional regulator [Sulfitobacter sp.
MNQEEIRCTGCSKLLFKMDNGGLAGSLSIKCPRCRQFNNLRPMTSPSPERPDREGKEATCGSSYHQKT